MRLRGKVAIVTGGGTGMGRAISLLFAREGAAVVVNYSKSRAKAEEVASRIQAAGSRALALRADVSLEAECKALVDQTLGQFGRLDLLINNAGWTRRIPHAELDSLTDEIWDRTFAVNVKGVWYLIRAAVPHLRKDYGSIVNITSVAAFTGFGSSIAYCASKAALTAMTKSLARALAPEIRVNAIAPGFVDTGFVDWPREVVQNSLETTPIGRLTEPEDVAALALFLASDDSRAMTAATLFADGGITVLGPKGVRKR